MKTSIVGLCVLGLATLCGSANAQCGCGSGHYATRTYAAPMVTSSYAAPMTHSAPMSRSSTANSVSFVNKLATPLDRGSYTLQYAVHLSNGRVLYTDYIPNGFSVSGMENGRNGRRVNADVGADGLVNVNDPATREIIALIPR